jgi:DNA recombination protein RmuC
VSPVVWVLLVAVLVEGALLAVLLVRSGQGGRAAAVDLRAELRSAREESARAAAAQRDELARGLAASNETLGATLGHMAELQRAQLDGLAKGLHELSESNQTSLTVIRQTVDARVRELQEGNEKKLEEMRRTVDEKLQSTLEKRLGESFQLVSKQLESVQQGLGEMQNLASGVGDLKRVLTNVKARGTWAEVQLGALLDEILAPGQYERNVHVEPGAREMVEFAVKLPGPRDEPGACVWLPIDSKLPQEDYVRIQDAADAGDAAACDAASTALARAIRLAAQDIHTKYVRPPHTTDFAIMFLGTEGLYAEVVRQPALCEELQHRYRIVVAGPTTLAALLSSLRMGFQTLAIEQQAVEVWRVLAAVKTEFAKFGEVLDKVKRQLATASRTIEETGVRTRAMERKLRAVEQLPDAESRSVLELGPDAAVAAAADAAVVDEQGSVDALDVLDLEADEEGTPV